MQTTSALYNTILGAEPHWFEVKVNISGVGDITEDKIFLLTTRDTMFDQIPTVGKAVAAEIDLQVLQPSVEIPKMAEIKPYVRVRNETQQSEWLQQGVFYVDTREVTANGDGLDIVTLHGFDAMLKAEQPYATTALTFPATDISIVNEIAGKMGVTVDARTTALMTAGYTLPLPTGYSLREYLGYIASMYVGCFIITETGALRLVSLTELPPETNYLITAAGEPITFGGDRILV